MEIENYHPRLLKEELILRDMLAIERTELANERTLLSYVRTTFGLLLAGITVLHFFNSVIGFIGGWIFILSSGIVLIIAYHQFKTRGSMLQVVKSGTDKLADNYETGTSGNIDSPRSFTRFVYNIVRFQR